MRHDKKLIAKIALEVEAEYQMGGLSSGLYLNFATDVAIKYTELKEHELLQKILFKSNIDYYENSQDLQRAMEKINELIKEKFPNLKEDSNLKEDTE